MSGRRPLLLLVPLALAAAYIAAAPGLSRPGRALLLAVAALVLALLVSRIARAHERWHPGRPSLRLPRRRRPAPLADLARIEWMVAASASSDDDFRRRLRPLLREIAAVRLARSGADLDADPGRARALVGEEAWQLLTSEPPPGRRGRAGGVDARRLGRVVERLEAL